jgi:hypothetical protein
MEVVVSLDPYLQGPDPEEKEESALWGWIAGIAVIILIMFVLVGGWYK